MKSPPTIISEHLDVADAAADLDAALRWQRQCAWIALGRWERGDAEELSFESLRDTHEKLLRPVGPR